MAECTQVVHAEPPMGAKIFRPFAHVRSFRKNSQRMSEAPPVTIPHRVPWAHGWLALAGYLCVACLVLWPLPTRMSTHMLGDPFGDPLLNAWILAWDADRMRHGLQGLWQAPMFYPAPDTLAWSEHLLGIAVFFAPVYWLTANPVLVYNIALLGSVVLAGMGMYLLTRDLTARSDAAWIAGLLYCCLPYRVAHLPHLQVLYAGWMPLALLALHRYFRTGSRGALAGFVLAYVLTALSNGYYLFFLAVPVAIVSLWHIAVAIAQRGPFLRYARDLTLSAVVVALALAPVVLVYLRVRATQGFSRTVAEMSRYSATPGAYGSISSNLRVWRDILPVGGGETELFPGALLTLLACAGLAAGWRTRTIGIYGTVAVVAFVLTLGPRPDFGFGRLETGPYDWLLLLLPGLDGLRVPARFAMVGFLGLSVLAAFGAAWLTPSRRVVARGVFALASAAAVAEGIPITRPERFPVNGMRDEQAAYQWLRSEPRGPMLVLPVGWTAEGTRYLIGTLTHGNTIVNGYSGYSWKLEDFFGGPLSVELVNAGELLRAARAVGLRYLVVHRTLYENQAFAADLVHALGQDHAQVEQTRLFGATAVLVMRPAPAAKAAPRVEPQLTLVDCETLASHNPAVTGRATDGAIGSRWLTAIPQSGSEWYEVRCPATRVLTGLHLQVNRRSYSDYPRRLGIDVSEDGRHYVQIWEGSVTEALARSIASADRPTEIRIDLQPTPFRTVRLRQTGRTPRHWFWSIDELQLRGR